MFSTKRREKSLAVAVLLSASAFGFTSTQANAALLTLSKILTNNTSLPQNYEFSESLRVTDAIAMASVKGSMSMVVTDFNRNGAYLKSDGDMFYSGWINGVRKTSFTPGGGPIFQLHALARGMAQLTAEYGTSPSVDLGHGLAIDDLIEIKFNFRLSAGDQVALTGTFHVVPTSSVPAPAAGLVALATPLLGLHRRRRTENAG